MGDAGIISGFGDTVTGLQPVAGGMFGNNRGRVTSDEYRALGYPDNVVGPIHNGVLSPQALAGAGRTWNTNSLANHTTFGNYPGDLGSVFNLGGGNHVVNNVAFAWSALYNSAGTYYCTQGGSSQSAVFESGTNVSDMPGGAAVTLPAVATVVGAVSMIANNSGTVTPSTINDVQSGPAYIAVGSGTLTVPLINQYHAKMEIVASTPANSTVTKRVGYNFVDPTNDIGGPGLGACTTQIGFHCPSITVASSNIGISLMDTNATVTNAFGGGPTSVMAPIQINVGATQTINFVNSTIGNVVQVGGTFAFQGININSGFTGIMYEANPVIKNTSGNSNNWGSFAMFDASPTFQIDTQTVASLGTQSCIRAQITANTINSGVLSAGTLRAFVVGGASIGSGITATLLTGLSIGNATISGTVTTQVGVDIAALSGATANIGIRNLSSLNQQGSFIPVNVAVTVTTNAGTVPVTSYLATFTNSSAATMAITLAVTGATDGQLMYVRVYDFSAVTQTIGWTNTENGTASVPTTSNGSTTLPRTVGFMFNSATTKWRCILNG